MSAEGLPAIVTVSGLASEARIASGPGIRAIALAGGGRRLADALERELARGARGIMSFGIAGGLDRHPSGTCIVGRAVIAGRARWACDSRWTAALLERLPGAIAGDVAAADAPVMRRDAKRALRLRTGAEAVDTESHIAAEIAARRGLPFAVLRVVADTARQGLPPVAAVAVASDGRIRPAAALASIARRPGQLPSVLRTAIDTHRALRALSRSRRLLGVALSFPDPGELLVDVR